MLSQVSYKGKQKITLTMRKLESGLWVRRWSPRREQITSDSPAAVAGGSGEPTITEPPSDDDDTE